MSLIEKNNEEINSDSWQQETDHTPEEPLPTMNTLTERVNKAIQNGYVDNFKLTGNGLFSEKTERNYLPQQISIIDFYRFEGDSDPADNSIMYMIETYDGLKGVLIDAYGAYADARINKFIREVEEINKKENTTEQTDKETEA